MGKIVIVDAEPTNNLPIDRVEIVTDSNKPDRVELYLLDGAGERMEGGTFDLNLFMNKVIEFYNEHY
jgi:hypothetical protein